jgi:hypothetical protein
VFVVQPVIPINLNSELFPYHIIRPTLPLISPPDPNGPLGRKGGVGDLTLIDVLVHPIKELKTSLGVGYAAILPTSTDSRLGPGEWYVGPSALILTRAVPKWVIGTLVQAPISVESNRYVIQTQLIATRLFEDQWYAGWGDVLLLLDDESGNYDLPISLRVGKVVKFGKLPVNIFLQGQYTPAGFQSPGGTEWGIKLSVTLLLPDAKLGPLLGGHHNHEPAGVH